VVSGAVNTLKSASKQTSVKAFVYTSSSWAAASPQPDVEYDIDSNSWNTHAVEVAWAPPPYTQERTMDVYAAGKTQAEQESWKFIAESKPGFAFSAGKEGSPFLAKFYCLQIIIVLPSANFGTVLDPQHQGFPSTTAWFKELFEGSIGLHPYVPPRKEISLPRMENFTKLLRL
jgi:hypothetical protein